MSKTDKELTVEILNNFVTSWNSCCRTEPIDQKQLIDLIKDIHKTIQDLPEINKK